MDDAKLATLINELKALKVQESQIIQQIEAISSSRTDTSGRATTPTRQKTTRTPPITVNGIGQGDRVIIKNKIHKPAACTDDTNWTKERERVATVTKVTKEQIHFITDNGTRTWRAPNNLSKLPSEADYDERHR
jgi:hypothetical protein